MDQAVDHALDDETLPADDIGGQIFSLASEIFPLARSLTGAGVRDTLAILRKHINIDIHEIPTGQAAYDWTIPQEWNLRDAYVKDASGSRVIDLANSNLHVMGYSHAIHRTMPLSELRACIHTLPRQSDLIPYKTAYYADCWGICMSHNQLLSLEDGDYEVMIDAEKSDGHLTYGEYFHPGSSEKEVLFSAHICHPSLANDNCSGLAVLTMIAAALKSRRTIYGYRFLFAPGTIGALAWLSENESRLDRIANGLVVSCIGDAGGPSYKRTRRGDATIDRIMACIRCGDDKMVNIEDFSPYGYDERQFCSPGFNLPVGLIQRSAHGKFAEYHTSADNLEFIKAEHLASSFRMIEDVIDALEENWVPLNLSPKGEPQLGRRGLFSPIGGHKVNSIRTMAYLWVLNLADGDHSILDVAERSKMSIPEIRGAAQALLEAGLLSNIGLR